VVARAAVTQSNTARAKAQFARRERLLAVKAREIAQIERAIQYYADMANRCREQSNTVMGDKLDARAIVERERLALAIVERDACPPVIDRP
jgi:hypothetical protein